MKKSVKILSVFLAVLTFFSILSAATPVFAEDVNEYIADKEYTEKLLTEVVENNTEEKAPIVEEIEEKRDEYQKVYLREDGTYTAVISKTPIHYEKDGEWTDIVNDLKTDGDVVTNTAGNFNVEFPKEISEDDEIKIENGKETITFSIVETEKSNGKVKNNKKQKQDKSKVSDEEIFNNDISRTVSEIEYEDILENTNLEYVVTPSGVKENIIVENKESLKKSYSFNITKGKLEAELDKSNNLYFKNNKGEVVFTIPAPVMTDSNGAISYDIDVKVKNLKKETITLTYTPDKKWLNDKDRAYPVAIDPVILLESDKEQVIEDTIIAIDDDKPDLATENGRDDFLARICESDDFKSDVLVKLNMDAFESFKRPNIAVTDVHFVMGGNVYYGNIVAKEIIGSWSPSTITGADVYPELAGTSNTPTITYSSQIVDYISGSTTNDVETQIAYFNITNVFNDWLKSPSSNNGFALTVETSGTDSLVVPGGKFTNSKGKTTYYSSYCTVDYVDVSGYNSSFEYLSQEIGRAGTFNVNTFTRGLSGYREDLSMSGNLMPVTLGFNFNSSLTNFFDWQRDYFSVVDEENYTLHSPYGDNWTPNYLKAIMTIDDLQYFYFTETGSLAVFNVSTDEDGNIVFEEDGKSESGYELSLIDSESDICSENLVITTLNGEKEYFNDEGFLSEIHESEPNADGTYDKITITYVDYTTLEPDLALPKISTITDGANRTYNFSYTNDKLISVTCKSSSGAVIKAGTTNVDYKTTYTYSGNNLTKVSYPTENATTDPMEVTYTYDSSGNLINAKNIDSYNITYTYDSLGKVTEISEYAGTTDGNYITLTQNSSNCVKVSDAYLGENTYLFSKTGELLYTFDDKGNYCKNASGFSFSDDSNADTVITDSSWKVIPVNLLKNSSFETQYSSTNSNRAQNWNNYFVRTSAVSHSGFYSYLVNSTSNVSKLNQQKVDVIADEYYTFSAYVKSATTGKLTLKIKELNSSNQETITEILNITNTDAWERFSLTFKTKTDTVAIYVMFGFDNSQGCYYVDTLQLEKGLGTAIYNYVENNTFTDNLNNWSTTDTTLSVVSETINGESVKALKLPVCMPYYTENSDETISFNNKTSSAKQTVKLNGKKGEVYSIGGWFKGEFSDGLISDIVKNTFEATYTPTATRTAQIKATYTYTDESGVSQTENFAVNFESNVDGWQYASESFALKGDVTTIDVTVITQNICVDTFFTNIALANDVDAVVISQDETDSTNVATIDETDDETITGCICEDCEDLDCTCTCTDETTCTCIPCTRRSNIESISADGKNVTTKMYDGNYYLQSATTYSDNLNYVVSETDENNISTSYEYNDNGTITSLTNGTGVETLYESNAKGYLSLAETDVTGLSDGESNISLTFSYKNDELSTVETKNVVYSYTYDIWGQTKSVSVDNQKLVQYNYGVNQYRSRINNIEYQIDSDTTYTLNYIYDEYGNVTQVVKTTTISGNDDEIVYTYHYDNLGKLLFIDDSNTGRVIRYSDDGGVTIEATGVGDYSYQSSYNDDGEFVETIDGVTYTAKSYVDSYNASTGDTTQKEAVVLTKNSTTKTLGVTTVTDWFGRNKTVTVSTNDPTTATTTSDVSIVSGNVYNNSSTGVTTNLVRVNRNTITSPSGNKIANHTLSYDANGRIITKNTASSITGLAENNSYAYDEAGQLIRENKSTQKTWVYEYDSNGNITKRKAYNYTTSTPSTLVTTDTFTYATGTWEDRLVYYNGQSIIYDNIGNPTTYLGATLTWHGRELLDYTKGTKSYQFSYDVDGMRYQKLVKKNSSQTAKYNYVYSDGQLILLSYTTNGTTQNAKFIYDSAGEVRGFVVNGTTQYLYVKNPQGDIVAIINESGVPVVRYIYDAWGNTTITTDSGYENLINLSPFAYRGYCYDNDIKMYYLQSRYYDPKICRFINADSSEYLGATGTVLSCNLFAYCENDPVDYVDYTGTSWVELKKILKDLGVVVKNSYKMYSSITKSSYGKFVKRLNSITKVLKKTNDEIEQMKFDIKYYTKDVVNGCYCDHVGRKGYSYYAMKSFKMTHEKYEARCKSTYHYIWVFVLGAYDIDITKKKWSDLSSLVQKGILNAFASWDRDMAQRIGKYYGYTITKIILF